MILLWTAFIVLLLPTFMFSIGFFVYIPMLARAETQRQKEYATKHFLITLIAFSFFAILTAWIADKLISIYQ